MKKNDLIKVSVLSRIKNWLLKIFHKSRDNKNIIDITNHSEEVELVTNNQKETQNIFEEYKQINDERQYLLKLQEKLESNAISEDELSSEDKLDLENLYIEQIKGLQRNIRSIDKKIRKLG